MIDYWFAASDQIAQSLASIVLDSGDDPFFERRANRAGRVAAYNDGLEDLTHSIDTAMNLCQERNHRVFSGWWRDFLCIIHLVCVCSVLHCVQVN